MASSIVVTGMGFITPLGNSLEVVWDKLLQGESAAQEWDDLSEQGFRHSVACRIPSFTTNSLERGREMAIEAAKLAVADANINLPKRTGIFVGSTIGESLAMEAYAEGKIDFSNKYTCLSFADSIQEHYRSEGPCRAYGTACAAGNYAIGSAANLLRNKHIDVAIAGGVDPFSRIAMTGFSRSRAMTSKGICTPFDTGRSGMMLGEGAAFLILEREEDALNRQAVPKAIIGSLGLSCDAYHPTAPNPNGMGMKQAMRRALENQNISADAISWICAHGTGTKISDATEARAISEIFGEKSLPVAGFKGAFGHTLGAATAIEAILCVQSLQKQMIPPTTNCGEPDASLPIHVSNTSISRSCDWVMNCGYAFGGLNAALLIKKWN